MASLSKRAVLAIIVLLITLGWALVALIDEPVDPDYTAFFPGFIFGTLFGQAALAAGWSALGPFALVHRLPLAVVWLCGLILSLGCLIARDGPDDGALIVLLVFAGALAGEWLLVQTPLWIWAGRFGLRIDHRDDLAVPGRNRDQQFGIRQLMLLTLIVALMLGGGRLLLGGMPRSSDTTDLNGIEGIILMVGMHSLLAVLVLTLAWMRWRIAWTIAAAALLTALVFAVELLLANWLEGSMAPRSARDYWMYAWLSAFQTTWIVGVIFVLRAGGFRLQEQGLGRQV